MKILKVLKILKILNVRNGVWNVGITMLSAILSGVAAARGFPPYLEITLFFMGWALFLFLLVALNLSPGRGALLGFLFGIGYFTVGFSWLITSIHEYGGFSRWIAYALLVGLASIMGLYVALFGFLMTRWCLRWWQLPLMAPALWVVMESARSLLLTGFPWNLAGYIWDGWPVMLQVADLGGIYLLSWLALFPAAMLATLFRTSVRMNHLLLVMVSVGTVLGGVYWYGAVRLAEAHHGPSVRVGLVQGNISQEKKWRRDQRDLSMDRYFTLTRSLVEEHGVDLVVWPETAITFYLHKDKEPRYREALMRLSREIQAPLVVGAPEAEKDEKTGEWQFFNSLFLLDGTGLVSRTRRYDKHHLVPFGEFIPFRRFLPETFRKFTEGTSDFSAGPGPEVISWKHGAIGPLICYEAIFPEEVRHLARKGARWLVNITNDGWFGESAKPQHLAMTRMRSVENRLPLIRVANTGISAAFDGYGRELARIQANTAAAIVVTLPAGGGGSDLYRQTGLLWVVMFGGGVVVLCSGASMSSIRNRPARS